MKLSSRKLQRDSKIELSMTSMIDVVFLLLIFFMTTASFIKTERNLDSTIKTEQPAQDAPRDLEPAMVDVVLGAGGYVYKVGGREFTAAKELTDLLAQFPNKTDGAIVRVSDGAPFGMAAAAIQAAKSANFHLVTYQPLSE